MHEHPATEKRIMTQPLQRLFISAPLIAGQEIELDSGQSHYLLHVLRFSERSRFLAFDGHHGEWIVEISEAKRNRCKIRVTEKTREQTIAQDLDYLFAPLKQARQDYMVQKAVEMGVSRLQPVITARTVVTRVNEKRMQANAIEAAEQCGILTLPDIRPAVKFATLLKNWEDDRIIIFCDERTASNSPLSDIEKLRDRKVAVLIGPEGGFSVDERSGLLAKSFVRPISLGPRLMRADTAAVAALALVNAVLGDWR